ncbi:MAG: hypothetical protein WC523_03410 [Patescibacteria group bacterium]
MKKAIKIIFLILGIIIVGLIILFFLVKRDVAPVDVVPGARTLYTGYVKIEPISLTNIKSRLEAQGCHEQDFKGEKTNPCSYAETTISYEKKSGIVVHPYGFGWGPLSFSLTEDKLWNTKDIPGSPDAEKFKEEVRQDVNAIGNIVQIKENTWKITETKYPWTVIY